MIFSHPAMTVADKAIVATAVVSLTLGTFAPRLAEAAALAFPFGVIFGWFLGLWPRLFANLRLDQFEADPRIFFVAFAPMIAAGMPSRLSITRGDARLALVAAVLIFVVACLAGIVKELLDPGSVTEHVAKWWAEQKERAQ